MRQAEIFTFTDEDYLCSMGFFGSSTPDQLLNTVIFCVGKGFALCAGQEHRVLRGVNHNSQFKFMRNRDGEIFFSYTEDKGLKTNKGGLKHMKLVPKTVYLYVTNNLECCPLRILIKYLSLMQKNRTCPAFYLQPRKKYFGNSWFLNCPVRVN